LYALAHRVVPLPSNALPPSSPAASTDEVVVALFKARLVPPVETETLKVLVAPLPHALFARTDIVPPELPAVVLIEVELDEPDHPEGSVQV
jgi:hypothetical protein